MAAIAKLAFDIIPTDPTAPGYRQGGTLGNNRTHLFRAKFGNGRFRVFFRFRSDLKIILYASVNDNESLRTYGAKTDAYRVFGSMLDSGNPPNDWDTLIKAANGETSHEKLTDMTERLRQLS